MILYLHCQLDVKLKNNIMYYHQKFLNKDDKENNLGEDAYIVVDQNNYDMSGEYMPLDKAKDLAYEMNLEELTTHFRDNYELKDLHSRDGNISNCDNYYMEDFFINDFSDETFENIHKNPKQFCKSLKNELRDKGLNVSNVNYYINKNIDDFIEVTLKYSNKKN